jgi:hypothetical protein
MRKGSIKNPEEGGMCMKREKGSEVSKRLREDDDEQKGVIP